MELIHKTFDLIDRVTNSNYVVLRNIDLIESQQSSIENDIDVVSSGTSTSSKYKNKGGK